MLASEEQSVRCADLQQPDPCHPRPVTPAEPGKTDAGKGFVDGLCKRLRSLGFTGEVYLVSLKRSHNVKDPNDLHKQLTSDIAKLKRKAAQIRAVARGLQAESDRILARIREIYEKPGG